MLRSLVRVNEGSSRLGDPAFNDTSDFKLRLEHGESRMALSLDSSCTKSLVNSEAPRLTSLIKHAVAIEPFKHSLLSMHNNPIIGKSYPADINMRLM